MKKTLSLLLLLFAAVTSNAQRDKEFQIRGGFGFAVYGSTSEFTTTYNILGVTFTTVEKEEDGAATVHMPLEFRYEFSRRFNAGLDIKYGSYLYDPDSAEGKSNRFVTIGIGAEYNFISNDNFRWYGGIGINSASLELEENYSDGWEPVRLITKYKGPGFRINTGILWYFAGPLGLNANLGFDSHNFSLENLSREQNGHTDNITNVEGELTVKGVDVTIGLVVRF